MNKEDSKINKKFNLENFITNFVYSNWNGLDYTYKIEDIEVDTTNEEELLEEELFYKDIVYNE